MKSGNTQQEVKRAMQTLCAPTPQLICFGCCPPIRPAHYDPLDHARILKREFRENRRSILTDGPRYRPIVGYSCWGLGVPRRIGQVRGLFAPPHAKCRKRPAALHRLRQQVRQGSLRPGPDVCRSARRRKSILAAARGWIQFFLLFQSTVQSAFSSGALGTGRAGAFEGLWSGAPRLRATELLERFPFLTSRNWEPRGASAHLSGWSCVSSPASIGRTAEWRFCVRSSIASCKNPPEACRIAHYLMRASPTPISSTCPKTLKISSDSL